MLNLNEITDIFKQYEYDQQELKDGRYVVFSSQTSMYPAVEIIPLRDIPDEELKEVRKKYSESGFAVRVCKERTSKELESYLFNWFFQVKESNRRIPLLYKEYTKSVMKAYSSQGSENFQDFEYKYIDIPFSVQKDLDSAPSPERCENLISDLYHNLSLDGPQLIIVEARAGFGKTSTAYELLNCYQDVDCNIRPFFMELSKDRTAPIFKYLLLSQIDRTFKVRLGSEIVFYNIKRGNIPLIIDGFDELLSKDLDNGQNNVNFKRVETMLSTIADLLTDQAKVVLTTRKTAIFSGENFYQWVEKKRNEGRNFQITRYQLGMPSLEKWLSKEKRNLLPRGFEKFSNPVILGYLRYLSIEEFKDVVKSDSLVRHYYETILSREKERQDLPLKNQEQITVLRKLAAYFAGFDMTACPRADVKEAIYELSEPILKQNATSTRDSVSLSNALSNHAFLDRKLDTKIGFLNDYVLGTFLMHAYIAENDLLILDYLKNSSYNFVDKAIMSASMFDKGTRSSFYKSLLNIYQMNDVLSFWADTLLIEHCSKNYTGISLDEKSLSEVHLGESSSSIVQCTFSNIIFSDCIFDFDYIEDCTFVNCTFNSCIKNGSNLDCGFYGCTFLDCNEFLDRQHSSDDEQIAEDMPDLKMQILAKYFQVDGRTPRMRLISYVKSKFGNDKSFRHVFYDLTSMKYILTNGDKSFISQSGIEYFNSIKYE